MRATTSYELVVERLSAAVVAPTLLLLGGDSPAFFGAAIALVHRALPQSRIETLEGQQHTAMNTAPELFLSKVLGFLLETSG